MIGNIHALTVTMSLGESIRYVAFLVYSWIHPYIADLLPEQLISDFKIH
jgi:hypothetical protein